MTKEWVSGYTDTALTLTGLFIFLFVFAGAVFLTFHRGRKQHFEKIENLPFE